jgi:hypothetical protein
MARKSQSQGKCHFCGRELTKSGITRHLPACPERQAAIDAANAEPGKRQTLYHLRAQDAWGGEYWLHLEVRGNATLEDLDRYLRAIWLECCGHLSQFSIGGWAGDEIPMQRKIDDVFAPDVELTHIYDFGTSSETLIEYLDTREGKPLSKHPIFLMARNLAPEFPCQECGEPGSWLCLECAYEGEASGVLCDEHAEDHPHDDYGPPMPIVNSPRVGMCGYDGPAEPPY